MRMWHGLPFEIHPKPDRRSMMNGHHRDVSASAFSISRWEDDGGSRWRPDISDPRPFHDGSDDPAPQPRPVIKGRPPKATKLLAVDTQFSQPNAPGRRMNRAA